METISCPKVAQKYCCEICDYTTSKKSSYDKHILTSKHKKLTNGDICKQESCSIICKNCNKNYKTRAGLWKHSKICLEIIEEKPNNIEEMIKQMLIPLEEKLLAQNKIQPTETALVPELIKQNQDYQKQSLDNQMEMFQQMMEFMKQQCATTNNIVNGNVNNNNNYTQFNLQVYLNETCKNAMTVNQFLDYLQPTVEELEATAHLGYVEGISRIIMRGFKNLEEHELPFHCTDLKREHIYVKNPHEEWVEEKDEKPLLLLFIKEVARKNFNNISAWQKKNPNWSNYHSKQNDMFMKILNNSVSGATEEEQQANYEKIMKNIMKNTVIDKSKKNSK